MRQILDGRDDGWGANVGGGALFKWCLAHFCNGVSEMKNDIMTDAYATHQVAGRSEIEEEIAERWAGGKFSKVPAGKKDVSEI
jgi:hypothetical protein